MHFLFKSTILALAVTSSVHALDGPVIRGSAGVDCTAQYDCCQSGTQAGEKSVNSLWASAPFYGNCDNVWDLSASADDMKNELYPANTGSWRVQAYNECARDYGVEPRVAEIEEQCLEDDSSQCIDLGETAASMIVYANVCDGYSTAQHQDYLQTCREVAYHICEGSINDKIKQQCPDQFPVTTSELSFLMTLCEDQVNSMTGGGGDDKIVTKKPTMKPTRKPKRKPTRKPTKKPTRKPTKKPTKKNRSGQNECLHGHPYPSGSFCSTAHQQCCSSVKKYDHWSTFCEYYGLPYPGELSQGIFPWTFLTVDCTMCGTSKCTSDETEIDVAGIDDELNGKDFVNDGDSAGFEENVKDSEVYVDVANISEDNIIIPQ